MIQLKLPASREDLAKLRAGDAVLLSGFLYTARDAAHQRLVKLLNDDEPLPFDLRGAAIYYAGPSPAPEGLPIGSCGPTTSARMDAYAPALLRQGHNVMVGKGPRSCEVVAAMKESGSVYFAATGGAGALLAMRVKAVEPVCFEDLGTEAIRKLTVEDFPVIVAIDAEGGGLFAAQEG
ncbi:MAG: FumA C-terminus/TtdB family hydratase beta subunit [Christensenellaceae bacterium]|jgi:fumarate hydratase subunit beta|nr:FumA C-terminus/TtdB family hydratase beta subunit [Christensenellaceae bacterium]